MLVYIFYALFLLAVVVYFWELIFGCLSRGQRRKLGKERQNGTSTEQERAGEDVPRETKSEDSVREKQQEIVRRRAHEQAEQEKQREMGKAAARDKQQQEAQKLSEDEERKRKTRETEMRKQLQQGLQRALPAARTNSSRNSSLLIDRTNSFATSVSQQLLEERRLRDEQDEEFQRALLLDQERMLAQKKKEEEQAADAERMKREEEAKEVKRKQDDVLREQNRKLRRERYESLSSEPPPSPLTGSSDEFVVKLRIRLPEGEALERRFGVRTVLRDVWYYIEGLNEEVGLFDGRHRIVSHFPRRVYNETSQTLQECGLGSPIQLFVEEVIPFS